MKILQDIPEVVVQFGVYLKAKASYTQLDQELLYRELKCSTRQEILDFIDIVRDAVIKSSLVD